MHRKILPGIIFCLLLSAACNHHPVSPFEAQIKSEQQDIYTTADAVKVDILWVIDNSASMCDEQQSLRESFDLFVEALVFEGVDFNIAVITTDMIDPLQSGRFQNMASGQQGPQCQLQIDTSKCPGVDGSEAPPMVISSSAARYQDASGAPDVEKIKNDFGCRATAGSSGDGIEQGLDAARSALSPALLQNHNAGFLRDDALLAIFFLSDENDCSLSPGSQRPGNNYGCEWAPEILTPVSDYVDFFQNFKRGPDGEAQPERVVVAGIIGPDNGIRYSPPEAVQQTCFQSQTVDPNSLNEGAYAGYRYEELIKSFRHSGQASICETPFESALATISQVIPDAVALCLNDLPSQCTAETGCGEATCEARGNFSFCSNTVIRIELDRDEAIGAMENRDCRHLPAGRIRCILAENQDYIVDYASSCSSGVGIDLQIDRLEGDVFRIRYPRSAKVDTL